MSPATTPALKLKNGVTIPALGLGVFQSPPEDTVTAVETALRKGYRLIDTAAAYANGRSPGSTSAKRSSSSAARSYDAALDKPNTRA